MAKKKTARKAANRTPAKKAVARKPARKAAKAKPAKPAGKGGKVTLLIGTLKGAFTLTSDAARKNWRLSDPIMLGNKAYHVVADPRKAGTWLMASSTGHLGPTVFRSHDSGKTWKEASQPPAFPKVPEGQKGRTVKTVFWLTPSLASEPGVWYAGTGPIGLWKSTDNGDTWTATGFNSHPRYEEWAGDGDVPEVGQIIHSINIDPRDPKHIVFGASGGGMFESTDGGTNWSCVNKGVSAEFLPTPDPEHGHDVHNLVMHPANPDRLYQQNHCGIYRLDRPGRTWVRIGNNMPKDIGDSGFVMGVHPRKVDTIFVFPMVTSTVWPRTAPGGKPAVYRSDNGGNSWKRCDKGWPKSHAHLTVKRQALAVDRHDPVGVYAGTTSGGVWASTDEGKSFSQIAAHLPHIVSVEVA